MPLRPQSERTNANRLPRLGREDDKLEWVTEKALIEVRVSETNNVEMKV